MNRRGFLSGIIALGAAPAIVRADSLMRVVPRSLEIHALPVWKSNSYVKMNLITQEALKILEQNLIINSQLLRGCDESGVIHIRRPPRFT